MRWASTVGCAVASWTGLLLAQPLPCVEDDTLSATAADLLVRGERLAPALLLERAREHGFGGTQLHARESVREESLQSFLDALTRRGEGTLVCGEARTEARRLLLATLRGGQLWHEGGRLYGALEPGFSQPRLVLELHDGELVERACSAAELSLGLELPELSQVRRVQLSAESASGPRPVAELRLTEAAPARRAEPVSELSLPAILAELTRLRRAGRAGMLRVNRLLSASADAHARRVCELGRLAHKLDGDDPEGRLRKQHIVARGAGEVLARGSSLATAFEALWDSPAHRLALSRPDLTDVGIGSAQDARGQHCLVIVVASWPRWQP